MRTPHRGPGEAEGASVLGSALARGPAATGKQSGAGSQRRSSPARFPDPPGSLTSLTYFPFPFREHVQPSQEHGEVSVVPVLHLIAIPPFLNASPRLPLCQHLLAFLRQEARPGCMIRSCFQGLGAGEDSGRRGATLSGSRAAGLGLLLTAKTPGGPANSRVLWPFLAVD